MRGGRLAVLVVALSSGAFSAPPTADELVASTLPAKREEGAALLGQQGDTTAARKRRPAPGPPRASNALLAAGASFALAAAKLPGVRRIAVIGSISTTRASPKDIDFLVTVSDDADLAPLATLARRLQGRLQSRARGADVFLADERGRYLGRTCPWVVCRPGVRARCEAMHCGKRPHLHDDFASVRLGDTLVAEPPLELWPRVVRRCDLPADVEGLAARFEG